MNVRTDLQFVLEMRNGAAEILRKHTEAASRVGTAYSAAARGIDVFRKSLQQTVTGMASLTRDVRAVGSTQADSPALPSWTTAEVGDPAQNLEAARRFEAARDVVREMTARSIDQGRPILGRRDRAFNRVDETGGEERATIALLRGRASTADHREPTRSEDRRLRWPAVEREGGLRDGRIVASVPALPDFRTIGELKAALEAILRAQILTMRPHPASAVGLQRIVWPSGSVEPSRSATTIPEQPEDSRMSAAAASGLAAVMANRNAVSVVGLGPERPTQEPFAGASFDDAPFATLIAAERRAMIAEIGDYFASLSREVSKAAAQARQRFELESGKKSEDRILGLLKLELKRLATTGRDGERIVTDRGMWPQAQHDAAVETVVSRRPSAIAVPEWVGATYPEVGAIGADLREATAGWQAYGNGIAKALGATDQALTGILTQTRDWRSTMHSLINSVVADFARIAIRQNITGPLSDAILGDGRAAGDGGFLGRAFGWITSLFSGGGIMTADGRLPLRTYASGGIATSPQLALFGEGSTPEAYVPVPNGRIPVTLRGGGGGIGSIATNIVINVTGGDRAADAVVGSDPTEQARNIGALVSAAFNRNLAEQMRPGGLLNPAGNLGTGLVH